MKHLGSLSSLLLLFGLASTAAAQIQEPQSEDSSNTAVAAARCQYTPNDQTYMNQSGSGQPRDQELAQFPRRLPGPRRYPGRPPVAYGRRGYPGMGAPMFSGRHMLIGALVGFGLGAAAGAKANTDTHPGAETKAVFLVGSAGGVLGALIGGAVRSFPPRHPRWRRSWPDDEDEQAAVKDQGSGARGQRPVTNETVQRN